MKAIKQFLFITVFSYSFSTLANTNQFYDPLDGMLDLSQYLSENAYGFLPVPIIITDPAVDGGLGMIGLLFHETEEEKEARLEAMTTASNAAAHLIPPSVSAIAGAYTGNDSYFLGGGHMGFFNKGKIRYVGGAGYGDINIDFYGFGNIGLIKPIELKTKASLIMQSIKFQLADSRLFLGPTHRYIEAELSPKNLGDLIENIPPEYQDPIAKLLTQNVTTSGVGFTMEYDSRNNVFSPTAGLNYKLDYLWFDERVGSDIDYNLTEASGLHYFEHGNHWRSAFRIEVNYADSNALLPPYATPSIKLRGIPSARYQGKSVAMSEAELTYQFNVRFGVNIFAGLGKASNNFSELGSSASRINRGVGFRYLIARRYGFNMGLDVAKGPEETVFYIQAGSSW